MSIGDVVTRTCKTCSKEFPHIVKSQGRHPEYCPTHATQAVARYRATDKYRAAVRRATEKRRETYDPWLWENTILDWDE